MGAKKISNDNCEQAGFITKLKSEGLINFGQFFSKETVKRWNDLLDPLFAGGSDEEKSYVKIDKLHSLGIFNEFFNPAMRSMMNSIMPDPVLLCFHVYETGHSEKPHVFSESFDGWHRDVNDLPGLSCQDPNFISIFVHLTDVEYEGGAFETIPGSFEGPLASEQESVRVTGEAGTTYIWNRCLLHKANPNKSQRKRRMLKISFQHNYLQNEHIISKPFEDLLSVVKASDNKDAFLEFILGSEHRFSPRACTIDPYQDFTGSYTPFKANSSVKIGLFNFVKGVLFYMRKARKMFGP